MPMKMKFNVGIVGARRGTGHIQPFRTIMETDVAALCDLNEETLHTVATEHGIAKQFTDYEKLLEDDDIQIIVLATPENLHVSQTISALNAGKHVISEVTAAVSLDQCAELVRAVKKSRTKYMMAENYCYLKSNVLIGNMVRQGMFGEIYFGEGEYLHSIKSLHHDSEGNPTWRYYWQVGVNRCNYATHHLGPRAAMV